MRDRSASGSSSYVADQADDEQDQEDEKQNLGDSGCRDVKSGEAQKRRANRYDEENKRQSKHIDLP
jgi:hypothetical protein